MASELHPWRFELEICPSRLPCEHVFEPKLNAQQGAICEAFKKKNALSRAHRDVLVPTSLWLRFINSLPFATVVFWLHLKIRFFLKEKHGKKTLFTATNCSTLARHALKLICQTTFDSILFKSLLSHAGQLSCGDVTEVTWPKRRNFSLKQHRCSKCHVGFHSNQYFSPQENVNLSNEQRLC